MIKIYDFGETPEHQMKLAERVDRENNRNRFHDPILIFEKIDEESPWSQLEYFFWLGAMKSYECSQIKVYSNFDNGQFSTIQSNATNFTLKGYPFYEDDDG